MFFYFCLEEIKMLIKKIEWIKMEFMLVDFKRIL